MQSLLEAAKWKRRRRRQKKQSRSLLRNLSKTYRRVSAIRIPNFGRRVMIGCAAMT